MSLRLTAGGNPKSISIVNRSTTSLRSVLATGPQGVQGERGDVGPEGPQGLDSLGAEADNATTAGYVSTDGPTKTAVAARIDTLAVHEFLNPDTPAGGPNLILGSAVNRVTFPGDIAADIHTSVLLNPGGNPGRNNIIGGDGNLTVKTVTPNATKLGTDARVSVVGGYDCVAGQVSSKIISDHSWTEAPQSPGFELSAGHNSIYGGANNVHRVAASFAGIISGKDCDNSGVGAFITGDTNVNLANGVVVGGNNNTLASGATNSLVVGASNTAGAGYGTILGQQCVTIAGATYGAAVGLYARSATKGHRVQASGRFATTGDAQTGVGTHYVNTTDATANVRLQPGGAGGYHTLQPDSTAIVEAHVVARSTAGAAHAAFIIRGVVRCNTAGVTAILGNATIETLYNDLAVVEPNLQSSSAGEITVRVTGVAATDINWMSRFTLTEVGKA